MSSMNAWLDRRSSLGVGPVQDLRGRDPLVLLGREAAGEDGLGDQGQRDAQVERRDDGPLAGALLAGGVEDQVDQRLAGLGILEAEDVAGDLDQVAVERRPCSSGRRPRACSSGVHAEQVLHAGGRPRR